jgi:hypothetical protein
MTSTGAPQIELENFGKRTVIVSDGGSAASEWGAPIMPATPAEESVGEEAASAVCCLHNLSLPSLVVPNQDTELGSRLRT